MGNNISKDMSSKTGERIGKLQGKFVSVAKNKFGKRCVCLLYIEKETSFCGEDEEDNPINQFKRSKIKKQTNFQIKSFYIWRIAHKLL